MLAGSLIPTTIAGHPFWPVDSPAERRNQEIHFLKNLGLLGGLLLAAADTEGRPGLRWRASHAVDHTQRIGAPGRADGAARGADRRAGRPPAAHADLPGRSRAHGANHLNYPLRVNAVEM